MTEGMVSLATHTGSVYPQRKGTCTGRACNVSVCVCLKALQLYFNLSTDYKDTLIKMRWRCTNSRYLKQVGEVFFIPSLKWCVSGSSGSTAWATSQPHYPRGHAGVLHLPHDSSPVDSNIFTVINFKFTFQSQVSAFFSTSHLCLPPDLSPEHPIYHLDWRSLYTLKGQWGWEAARACCRMENKGKKCTYP